jgi:hypothetical protein
MTDLSFAHSEAVSSLAEQVAEFIAAARSCDDMELLAASPCHGWSKLDVVVHVRMGLQEMAMGTTCLDRGVPDHDAASYWSSHPDNRDEDPVAHILWLRRVASAYGHPAAAVQHLEDVAASALTATCTMGEGVVSFQGSRLRTGDFLGTWVVELAVHQLDLGISDDRPSGLGWARATLEALAGEVLPSGLDDRSAVLLGLGRVSSPWAVDLGPSFPVSL